MWILGYYLMRQLVPRWIDSYHRRRAFAADRFVEPVGEAILAHWTESHTRFMYSMLSLAIVTGSGVKSKTSTDTQPW